MTNSALNKEDYIEHITLAKTSSEMLKGLKECINRAEEKALKFMKENLEQIKKEAQYDGVVIHTTIMNPAVVKEFARSCLKHLDNTKEIMIFCNKATKLHLMEYFILDGFNDLGMMIKIESTDFFEDTSHKQFEMIVTSDGKGIGHFMYII